MIPPEQPEAAPAAVGPEIHIYPEFRDPVPRLTDEEREGLERSLLAEGVNSWVVCSQDERNIR